MNALLSCGCALDLAAPLSPFCDAGAGEEQEALMGLGGVCLVPKAVLKCALIPSISTAWGHATGQGRVPCLSWALGGWECFLCMPQCHDLAVTLRFRGALRAEFPTQSVLPLCWYLHWSVHVLSLSMVQGMK